MRVLLSQRSLKPPPKKVASKLEKTKRPKKEDRKKKMFV